MRSSILLGAALGAASPLTAAPASARDWPETAGWTIVEGDDTCSLYMEFEGKGETQLIVVVKLDESSNVALTNAGWSAEKGETYEVTWALNGNAYTGKTAGIGERFDRRGFAGKFGPEFISDFAAGSSMRVYLGDTLIDQLSLDGSSAALGVARRCLQAVRRDRDAADRERRRFSHIPDDPFAKPPPPPAKGAGETDDENPGADRELWANLSDFPSRAMRERRGGSTTFRAQIDANGSVAFCAVIESSGHADLDAETCKVVKSRAKALAASGTAAFTGLLRWNVP